MFAFELRPGFHYTALYAEDETGQTAIEIQAATGQPSDSIPVPVAGHGSGPGATSTDN